MKDLTTDLELIKFVCLQSEELEVRLAADGKDKIRRKEGWEKWVLSIEERDPSAQNDGPRETEQSHSAYSGAFMQSLHHAQMNQQFDMSPRTNTGHFEHQRHPHQASSSTSLGNPKTNGTIIKTTPQTDNAYEAVEDGEQGRPAEEKAMLNGTTSTKHQEHEAQHDDDTRDLLVAVKSMTSPVEVKSAEGAEANDSIAGYA